ncbi:MAG: type I DNA topoisomerase [Bacteroidales bacterium]|nr:type I DNA topoisomerase [Bacteroidales bacterium]
MGENLVIVESPAKAKTIEKFLGKGFTVKSSFGHIRDLKKKDLGIDIENGFEPQYEVPKDKKKVVSDLAAAAKTANTVWLASDEDREGEAIAWHLQQTLNIPAEKSRRIVFHEITKNAILNAIDNPRNIDSNLVMAQQARRVLDRLVGFELSPILWKKIQPKLSAGRVQSVALRLIVDREREISSFEAQPYFRVEGIFIPEGSDTHIKGVLDKRFSTIEETKAFLERCNGCSFDISSIEKKEITRTPAPPFTTSALQQEASRKLGFSVSQTMVIAQRLYESGLITYMRTDSTNLSSMALGTAKETITSMYGAEYSQPRNYKTKSKGAQEAHEAIRPTYISNTSIEGNANEKRLYALIWKRTIASQMADARLEKTDITISGEGISEKFIVQGEQIIFDGFLKVYIEGRDDEDESEKATLLPHLNIGQRMTDESITATEKFTKQPQRYSEASLVRKLEELGIGRPSTYAPTISTILQRGYVIKADKPGTPRDYREITLNKGIISSTIKKEVVGREKNRLCPENIGMVVTDFLSDNFPDILDYGFTAKVEADFDNIAKGLLVWNEVISDFYEPFHEKVTNALEDRTYTNMEKHLGIDPATGKPVIARMGRFGPLVQRGSNEDPDKQFVSLKRGQLIEEITLKDALQLLKLPRTIGEHKGKVITTAIGRFGPYIKIGSTKEDSTFISLPKELDPYTVTMDDAVKLIAEHTQKESRKQIAEFPEHKIQILNGRYGPYIKQGKNNYRIPRGTDPSTLDVADCLAIIEKEDAKRSK